MVSVQAHFHRLASPPISAFLPLNPTVVPASMTETCSANAMASPSPYVSIASGIFAYLNYLVSQKRLYVLETLINGLKRLEYRGYDSAGVWGGGASARVPVPAGMMGARRIGLVA